MSGTLVKRDCEVMGPAASLAFSVYIALINLARAGKHGHGSSAVSAGTVC